MQVPYASQAAPQSAPASLDEIGASGAAFLKKAIDADLAEIPYMLANCKTTDDLHIVRGRAMALIGLQAQINSIIDQESAKMQKLLAARHQER